MLCLRRSGSSSNLNNYSILYIYTYILVIFLYMNLTVTTTKSQLLPLSNPAIPDFLLLPKYSSGRNRHTIINAWHVRTQQSALWFCVDVGMDHYAIITLSDSGGCHAGGSGTGICLPLLLMLIITSTATMTTVYRLEPRETLRIARPSHYSRHPFHIS